MQRASRLRRIARLLAAALAAAACWGEPPPGSPSGAKGAAEAGDPAARPNLLLITVDTLRADRLACYGGEPDVGTAICSLAERGTLFSWAFAAAPYTAPSVAALLTSRYPGQHGVTQNASTVLQDDALTLAEVLARGGYQTAAFISNPVLERGRKLDQGFAVYDQRMNRRERNRPGYAERAARATTDAALAWAQVAATPPWFVWVHFQDPHGPYEPPDARPEREDPDGAPLAVLKDHSGRGGIPAYQALPGLRTPGAYARRYSAEIRYADPHVGRLVDGLDALGEAPVVILTSDHGEAFGEDDYWFAHGHSVGLDQIRVPLIVRTPAAPQPRTLAAPVTLVDVAPTLLRLAGLEIPDRFQGVPLPIPGVDPGTSPDRVIFAEHGRQVAAIRGDVYYARSRDGTAEGLRGRKSGDEMPPLPGRSARLPANGTLPSYEPTAESSGGAPLEAPLATFLRQARPSAAARREVPDEVEARMRALGYVDVE